MGWKKFKEKYGIKHTVHISGGKLHIGSAYVSNLVSVDLKTGKLVENSSFRRFVPENYKELYSANEQQILAILASEDRFEKKLPVFTVADGKLVEDFCEKYGWPNVTHSGWLMYDNVWFKTKEEALDHGIRSAESYRNHVRVKIADTKQQLEKLDKDLDESIAELNALLELKGNTNE